METGLRLLCLLIGYCFGMFQTAYILGRMRGIDIRNYGSGNAGTTNAMRVLGKKAGWICLLLDLLKCFLAVMLVWLLFRGSHPELVYTLKAYTFAGCVLGHDYPFYMKFKGGKGVAVLAGFVCSFHLSLLPIALLAFLVPFVLTHYVSLGSLCVYTAILITVIVEGQLGVYGAASQSSLIELYVIIAVLTVMVYYRHRANIGRLLRGCENKTYLFKKKTDQKN